jgi:cytoskeletal protein CcmA (bactofilin family)
VVCPSEFLCAQYADGELPEDEARQLREHFRECISCSRLVDALEAENRVLVHAFQEIDLMDTASPALETRAEFVVARLALVVFVLAVAVRAALDSVTGIEWPKSLEWLDPFLLSGQLSLLLSSIVYFVEEGSSMITAIADTVGLAVMGAFVLFGIVALSRRSTTVSMTLGIAAACTMFSTPSYALDVRRSSNSVTISAGETVDDTLVAFGESVIVDGAVTGDLFAFARRVTVRGTVRGDIISGAQTVEVDGMVGGNIFSWAQSVAVRGPVEGNVYEFGQTVDVSGSSHVKGNAAMFGSVVTLDGTVGRDLRAFGDTVDVRGDVARNFVSAARRINLLPGARVGGDLRARVQNKDALSIADGATVAGKTEVRLPEPRPSKYGRFSFYLWEAIWLAAAFITGLVLFWLFPLLRQTTFETLGALLKAGGIGFIACVAIPIAAIIIAITMIGLPIGLLALATWLLGLYLAKIVLAAFLGSALLRKQDETAPFPMSLLLGLVLIFVAVNLPYIGGVINVLLTLVGFGSLLMVFYQASRWRAAV